jgi:hypothetical protein
MGRQDSIKQEHTGKPKMMAASKGGEQPVSSKQGQDLTCPGERQKAKFMACFIA